MSPIRLGCVRYLNTLPLIEGLRTWKECTIQTAVPSRLIGMLMGGEVDVALASIIDASRGVTLLPAGMIGCDGPTLTVRLFSARPIETLERVHADTDSHTSVALLRVLMHRTHHRTIELVPFDAPSITATDQWPDAVLLIGDKVVTAAPPAERYPYQMDLGAAWKALTGLPFVYAAWMCRAGEENTPNVLAAAAMLDRQRRRNHTRLDWIVQTHAADKQWPADLARQYVGSYLKYDVGEAEREAVDKFFAWAGELGIIPPTTPTWASIRRPEPV